MVTDLEVSSFVGAGKEAGGMTVHLVIQPGGLTVILLSP